MVELHQLDPPERRQPDPREPRFPYPEDSLLGSPTVAGRARTILAERLEHRSQSARALPDWDYYRRAAPVAVLRRS